MTGALVDIPRDTIVVAPASDKFTVQDIGSGVAVFAFDPATNSVGVLYATLPASPGSAQGGPGRYANSGVKALIEQLTAKGTTPNNLKVAIVGAAESIVGTPDEFDSLASRTLKAVSQGLSNHGIQGIFEQTGGFLGRTVSFDSESGAVSIKDFRDKEEVVCNLRGNE